DSGRSENRRGVKMALLKLSLAAFTFMVGTCIAQTAPQTNPATPAPLPPDPAITQIRKSVTFIKLHCSDGAQEGDVRGTGFFVSYPEPRLGGDSSFVYLVTNRHVAMCWNSAGHPMNVNRISITMNRKQAEGNSFAEEVVLNDHGNVSWVVPQDASVDLA